MARKTPAIVDHHHTLDELKAARDRITCRDNFAAFVQVAWEVLEPDTDLIWNWHMQAICDHLQALVDGKFLELGLPNRLLINVPPGSSKSLLTSVLLQAWEWGPAGRPSTRYLSTSYNDQPVNRDTRKCRDLVMSDWYQARWPITMTRTAETSFANANTGTRQGVPFGSLTSQRGDRLVIDDPHSTETAESDAERVRTTRRFREGAQNRLNDQKRSAIIVIMQRLHQDDVSGVIDEVGMNYVHLMLPMEFEVDRACSTPIGFSDPRKHEGELLDPVRWPPDEIKNLKRDLGSYGYAGQYQQRPVPREGGLFKRHWFDGKFMDDAPPNTRWVRHWDLAGTKDPNAAKSAGVKIGRTPDGRFIVGHSITMQEESPEVRKAIKATAQSDGKVVAISLPQDPGQAGKAQARDLVAMLAGYNVKAAAESGDKYLRAEPFAAQCEAGNVYLIRGGWNEAYLDELLMFPGGKFADQVDASSGAFTRLTKLVSTTPLSGKQILHGKR